METSPKHIRELPRAIATEAKMAQAITRPEDRGYVLPLFWIAALLGIGVVAVALAFGSPEPGAVLFTDPNLAP